MTRRLIGAIVSLLALFAGLWLVLAPFALGFQPQGADWTDMTLADVWTGIPLAVVGLAGIIVFASALRTHMVQAGFIAPRPAPAHPEQAAAASGAQHSASDRASQTDELLQPLIAALARDLARDEAAPTARPAESHHHREFGTSTASAEASAPAMSSLR